MTPERAIDDDASASSSTDVPLQAAFFSAINTLTEPAVRAGLGSLWVLPAGLIVLETTGLRSGVARRVTLLAAEIGGYVVVSTLRVRRSQWLRNVTHSPGVRYWIRGKPHDAHAITVMADEKKPSVDDENLQCVVDALHRQATACGAAFVILQPAITA